MRAVLRVAGRTWPTTARSTAAYIAAHTAGFEAALARARAIAPDAAATAAATGLDEGDVARFFDLFRATRRAVTCFSQGVNQSAQGTDKVNAIINCHLATGRIGKPGMGPFSLTGQPNAMGGREVGGLANQLAAHMDFRAPAISTACGAFWNAPRMAEREGLKAVQMFEAIERGEIKALWVMATNPAVSLPRAGAMREALKQARPAGGVRERAPQRHASRPAPHVLLPAAAWGEKDGTVTNSERRISRQRAFLPPPGEARPDWWIVSRGRAPAWASARRSPIARAADVFREHAALSAFENDGARDFDLGGLADLSDQRLRRARAGAMAGADRAARRHGAAVRGWRISSRRTARRASSRPSRRRCSSRSAPNSRFASTPGGCATSGTP